MPPHFRGLLTSGFVPVASLVGMSVGPLAVGFATDHIFGSEAMVAMSIALVLALVLPIQGALLLIGRGLMWAALLKAV